jgi:hypothetical protein
MRNAIKMLQEKALASSTYSENNVAISDTRQMEKINFTLEIDRATMKLKEVRIILNSCLTAVLDGIMFNIFFSERILRICSSTHCTSIMQIKQAKLISHRNPLARQSCSLDARKHTRKNHAGLRS